MTKPLLNAQWISRLEGFKQLTVGFSGGLDSTVLLHLLSSQPSLRANLFAIHINHGISPNALLWQQHCENFCLSSGIKFLARSVEFNRSANVEEEARIARYKVFNTMLGERDCLVLGHHLDDQAETVLLQLFRGAGVDGLAAMPEFSSWSSSFVARPLLTSSRKQLEDYAAIHQLNWVEDESNQDNKYSRNFLRQNIMPLLADKWPGVVKNITRAALHCQQAKSNLDELAHYDYPELTVGAPLFIEPLKSLSRDRMSNVLRVWLQRNSVKVPSTSTFQRLIDELIFAANDAMPLVSWGDVQIRRFKNQLYLDKKSHTDLPLTIDWLDFPQPLILPEYNINLRAQKAQSGLKVPPGAKVVIKFRQGGEHMLWHGHTRQLKKLFQEWSIPTWLRGRIPLVYINEQLAMVAGYAVSDLFYTNNDSEVSWHIT